MVAIRTVNNTAPVIEPTKDGYKITKGDLYSASTGRSSETGHLMRYLIRANVTTIELQYVGTESQIASIESLYSAQTLSVEFRDNGSYITKSMYPSDRVKDTESLKQKGKVKFSVSLVEI